MTAPRAKDALLCFATRGFNFCYNNILDSPGNIVIICLSISLNMFWLRNQKNILQLRAAVYGPPSQIPTFLPLTLTLGSRSHKMLPSTSTSCQNGIFLE